MITDLDELGAILDARRRMLFWLETLDVYEVASDGSDYRRYLDGEPEPDWERKQWLGELRAERDSGGYRTHPTAIARRRPRTSITSLMTSSCAAAPSRDPAALSPRVTAGAPQAGSGSRSAEPCGRPRPDSSRRAVRRRRRSSPG